MKYTKTLSSFALCLPLGLVALASCSTTRVGDDVESVNSAKTITAEEWAMFADKMKDSIVTTGVLEEYRGPEGARVILAVGDFLNDTENPEFTRTQKIMRNEITKTFVNSGVAGVNMDFSGTGGDVDSVIQRIHELEDSEVYDSDTTEHLREAQAPKLVLHGQFIGTQFSEGRTTQYDYACNVSLIDVRTRATVWQDQIIFPKQFKKGVFG